MLPAGFLVARGDILMDLVVLSFLLILPLLASGLAAIPLYNFGFSV
jgi:hypothetical protein